MDTYGWRQWILSTGPRISQKCTVTFRLPYKTIKKKNTQNKVKVSHTFQQIGVSPQTPGKALNPHSLPSDTFRHAISTVCLSFEVTPKNNTGYMSCPRNSN